MTAAAVRTRERRARLNRVLTFSDPGSAIAGAL